MLNILLAMPTVLITIFVIYWFWIRPLLKVNPAFKEIYATSDSFWAALNLKLSGVKQKITAAILTLISTLVLVQGYIAPAMTGVDITPIIKDLPPWAWPCIVIGFTSLMNYFRTKADQQAEKKITALATAIDNPYDNRPSAEVLEKVKIPETTEVLETTLEKR